MSRIDELIQQHCPDGVEYRALEEVTTRSSNIKWAEASSVEHRYIDLSSVDRVTRRITQPMLISAGDAPSRAQQIVREGDVIFATTRPTQMRWAVIPRELDAQIASTGFCVLRPDQGRVLTNFLAHLLGAERFRRYVEREQVPGNYPSIPDRLVRLFRIPVPPMEVQREIVRVLDLFQSLEAELEAELEARRRQYELHRDSLLSFERDGSRVKYLTLSEIATEFGRGKSKHRPRNAAHLYGGDYPFVQTGDVRNAGHIVTNYSQTYSEAGLAQSKLWPKGTICITIAANIAETGILNFDACFPDSIIGLIVDPDQARSGFVEYLLQSFKASLQSLGEGSAQDNINLATFENQRFPIPSLAEQDRIVAVLDKFDALVNDLSVGLPAELAARRKQYEYYRDRLLTFQEAV